MNVVRVLVFAGFDCAFFFVLADSATFFVFFLFASLCLSFDDVFFKQKLYY